jgi:hypothetical protein
VVVFLEEDLEPEVAPELEFELAPARAIPTPTPPLEVGSVAAKLLKAKKDVAASTNRAWLLFIGSS